MSELASYKRGYDDCKEEMLSVIENIKAEIEEKMNDCATTSIYTRLGFQTSLNIIDKHIGG